MSEPRSTEQETTMRTKSEIRERIEEIKDTDGQGANRDYLYGQRIALEWTLGQFEFDDE